MPNWTVVSGVVWMMMPAVPVRVTECTLDSCRLIVAQVVLVRRSATRTSGAT